MALVVPAVLALVALGAAAQACLPCFTSHSQRLRICHMFTGRLGPEQEKCEEAFTAAFRGLLDVEFGSYKVGFANAARKMKMAISQIKPAQACIPPCGLQDLARLFRCRGCYSRSCNLPLDCPVQDVLVTRGDQAMFSCVVNFQLPQEEISYSWLFAEGGLRTQDVNYFREVPGARGYLARILPVQPKHSGTFSCVIKQDQRLLARLYFFLNVTGPAPRAETELQITFRKVLRWAPQDAELVEPWTPSLGELLARPGTLSRVNLGLLAAAAACVSASATLLAWLFFRWYLSDP
ncbi:sperm acrosome membrane-associated protein 6 isoform X4 [Ochotona princeps]|uniref:sperm acrosome membrane-associated protein 6 isoform X4 n=1 Tax=Ochotona princeps TaxID=9978 RepID=UPI002715277B|nr:sperm acrosome membrane-associated protein 6 isoform X4 [Ochotona princeps]